MKVAFLGSFGFNNLGDELCLYEAFNRFKSLENYVFSNDASWTRRVIPGLVGENFFTTRSDLLAIKPDRIVFGGGGVGFLPSIKDAIHWMGDHIGRNCELIIHNIGVANIGTAWIDTRVRSVFDQLSTFSVRDSVSFKLVEEWRLPIPVDITKYPEVDFSPISNVQNSFFRGCIGISITGQNNMRFALDRNIEKITALMADYDNTVPIVPIVSVYQVDNDEENDFLGFEFFVNSLNLHDRVKNGCLSIDAWKRKYTVGQLRTDIQNLSLLITQRKHNVIHAIGTGTRFISMSPKEDDSLQRVWTELGWRAVPGSKHICL